MMMRTNRCAAATVGMLIVAAVVWSQDAASDRKSLEGTWTPASAEIGGKSLPDELIKKMKLILKGDDYTVHVGDAIDRGQVKIDVTKKPKAMDIIGTDGPNKGKTFLAIYELEGDKLRVCYDLSGKSRPTEFKAAKEGLIFLATYQRVKS
jgi:uncharacterized protein (TIGR03067 family)